MPDPKMTAEERINERQSTIAPELLDRYDIRDLMEEHAAAAVKDLEARIAELERERDEERMRCREAAQTLIAAIGAAGPENVEDTARRAVHRIAELERILHDAPTIVEVEEYAPGWLNRVHTTLGKETNP